MLQKGWFCINSLAYERVVSVQYVGTLPVSWATFGRLLGENTRVDVATARETPETLPPLRRRRVYRIQCLLAHPSVNIGFLVLARGGGWEESP